MCFKFHLFRGRERPGVLDGDSRGPLDPAPCARQGIIRGRGLKRKAARPSSGCGIWTLLSKIKTWILMMDPDSSEDSRSFQPPELSGRTRDVIFPRRRPSVVSTGSSGDHSRSCWPIAPLSANRLTIPRFRMVRGAPCRLPFSTLHCSGSRVFASDAARPAAFPRPLSCGFRSSSWPAWRSGTESSSLLAWCD